MLDLSSAPLVSGMGAKSGHRQSMVDLRPPPTSDPRQRFSVASELPPHLRHYLVSDEPRLFVSGIVMGCLNYQGYLCDI